MMSSIRRPDWERSDRPSALTTPRCHRVMKSVGIADGDGHLARPHPLRISQPRPRQRRRVDPEHGQIGVRVGANQRRLHSPAVGQRHPDRRPRIDDVAVGEQEPIRREDHARPAAFSGLDADHCRTDGLHRTDDRFRIGVEQFDVGHHTGFRDHDFDSRNAPRPRASPNRAASRRTEPGQDQQPYRRARFVQGQRQDRYRLSRHSERQRPRHHHHPGMVDLVQHVENIADRFARRRASSLLRPICAAETTSPDQAGKLMMTCGSSGGENLGRRQRSPAGAARHHRVQSRHGRVLHGRCAVSLRHRRIPKSAPALLSTAGTPTSSLTLSSDTAPVLGISTEEDGFVTPEVVGGLDKQLTAAGKRHEFHSYPQARHAVLRRHSSRGLQCCGVSRCVRRRHSRFQKELEG